MSAGTVQAGAAAVALRRLVVLQELTGEALGASSRRELEFIVLNRTAKAARYERGYLWRIRGGGVKLAGVSGSAGPPPKNDRTGEWQKALRRLDPLSDAAILSPGGAAGQAGGLWLPLAGSDGMGLLLERLSPPAWTDDDLKALRPLASAYGGAFRIFSNTLRAPGRFGRAARAIAPAALVAAAVVALAVVRLPLRIVAPCEVVAANPAPVNAPMDGVIREVLVRPGDAVEAGDPLYAFDDEVAVEEFELAKRQAELARSNLDRAAALALSDRRARAEAGLLANRLEQEEVRLAAAKLRMEKLRVSAPKAGTVVMGDPSAFAGAPVRTGERVLVLAEQSDNRLRIWLPQDDRIDFRPDAGVRVFLHADAGKSRDADLTYVAAHAQPGEGGVYGFLAEAEWKRGADAVKLGLKGSAVLYGEEVSLGYWLFRKPLAAVRRFVGF